MPPRVCPGSALARHVSLAELTMVSQGNANIIKSVLPYAASASSRNASAAAPALPLFGYRRYGHQYSLAISQDNQLRFTWPGHTAKPVPLPSLWLRDNCRCAKCVNQDTKQRNFDTFQLSPDLKPQNVAKTEDGFDVTWSDSHVSKHNWKWLEHETRPEHRDKTFNIESTGWVKPKLWGKEIASKPPTVLFDDVMNDGNKAGMAQLTSNIREWGFCFVDRTPVTPEDTQRVLEKVGPIRETHYGGFYDFIPDMAMADTAYTTLALPAHTDTTYFTEPSRLQAFHMLSHVGTGGSEPSGGKSLLVDGLKVAEQIRSESPDKFTALAKLKIPWHASGNEGIAIAPDAPLPVFETLENDKILRVRWNNDDRGIVPLDKEVGPQEWYKAAARWNELLKSEDNEYWVNLKPGSLLIFDNWRVLHGRSEFTGMRRMCGGYISHDDFMSRWKTSNFSMEDVIGTNLHSN